MQDSFEGARAPVAGEIEAIAVVGLCAAERRRYAMALAGARDYVFVPAEQTVQGIEVIDRLVALVAMTPSVRGFVLEYDDETSCAEIIGALSAPESRAVLTDLVCVLDLVCLPADLGCEDRSALLVDQVEFASTLVLLEPGERIDFAGFAAALGLVGHLAPEARQFIAEADAVHAPERWDFGGRPPAAGWTAILNAEFRPPAHTGGVGACRYEQARPFHPQRLQAVLTAAFGEDRWGRIVRSAGFARLASRPYVSAHWDQAGSLLRLTPLSAGPFVGAGAELLAWGQELAVIGFDLDEAGLCEALDRAVLTDAELLAGPMAWLEYTDEFPAWDTAHRS